VTAPRDLAPPAGRPAAGPKSTVVAESVAKTMPSKTWLGGDITRTRPQVSTLAGNRILSWKSYRLRLSEVSLQRCIQSPWSTLPDHPPVGFERTYKITAYLVVSR
jgi:hypothetical protein